MRAVGAWVLVVLAAGATIVPAAAGPAAAGSVAVRCNGSTRLCDARLGEVAFATTHNSMASSVDGFVPPNQRQGIADQLESGVRGFQIDVHAGFRRQGRVYTDIVGSFGDRVTDLPAPLVARARRIHARLGAPPPGTPSDLYLCHTFCELGASRLDRALRQVRTFLDEHRGEVVVMVIEDYVAPERLATVFDSVGLGPMLVPVGEGRPLPTLGAMVRSGRRVLALLENGDGGPTLANAFASFVEETPFTFTRTRQLRETASCGPNRGVPGAPIFQFNHWVTPADRVRATAVNFSVLRDRVERCTAIRGRAPTLVAVDFAERSSVHRVVRAINRRVASDA